MTAPQIVVTITAVIIAVSVALVCAGVGMLWGAAWTLITVGALVGPSAAGAAVVLLRDDGK